ncbi:MAG: hypothetical protein EHM70_09115 [Chloroflexota bacterium]|nr:MAG: hypothetical protein EHM70_09115 [Chloroflexota bacterium]
MKALRAGEEQPGFTWLPCIEPGLQPQAEPDSKDDRRSRRKPPGGAGFEGEPVLGADYRPAELASEEGQHPARSSPTGVGVEAGRFPPRSPQRLKPLLST